MQTAMLTPVLALIAWTFVIWFWLYATRLPAMKVHNLIMLGSLPPRVREMYGLPWSSAHAVAFRATVAAVRAPRAITPRRIRVGGNTPQFELVARTESNRLMGGRPTPGVAA